MSSSFLSLALLLLADPLADARPGALQLSPRRPTLQPADLTADGLPELLHLHPDGALRVALNLGDGRFAEPGPWLATTPGARPVLDDLDGDGLVDLLLLADGANQALLGDGQGGLRDATAQLGLADLGAARGFERVDLDGAGRPELLLHNADGSVIFWARGGVFERDASTPDLHVAPTPADTAAPPTGSQPATAGLTPEIRGGIPTTPPEMAALVSALDARYLNEGALEVTGAFDVADGSLTSDDLSAGAVTASKLALGAVNSGTIADDSIKSNHIVDGSLDGADLVPGTITSTQLADDSIDSAQLAPNSVDSSHIGTWQVGNSEIAPAAVDGGKIADASILGNHIKVGTVDTQHLANDAVGHEQIQAGAIRSDEIADGGIESEDLGFWSVITDKIGPGSVDNTKLADNAVGYLNIADDAVRTQHIFDNAVRAEHLADGAVLEEHIGPDAITAAQIADGSVTWLDLAQNSVNSVQLIDLGVTNADLASNAVTSSKISSGAVTASKIADGAVNSAKITDGSIQPTDLDVNSVTASAIAANAVGASEIAANAVGSSEIATGAVGPSEIANDAVDSGEVEDFGLTGPDVSTLSGNVSHAGGTFTVEGEATFEDDVAFDRGIVVEDSVEAFSMFTGDGIFSGYYFGNNPGAEVSASTLFGPQLNLGGSGPPGVSVGSYRMGINADPHPDYRLRVSGEINCNVISKGSGTFKIDHPLDPENQYLSHSFVESPDMLNLYSGSVELDALGMAEVALPDWFEALNTRIHYQLTPIGGFAPVYVAQRLQDGVFTIAGGAPGMEVSWMLTGVRQDKFALANPVIVETPKKPEHRGSYLHPAAWGQSPERGEDHYQNLASRRAWEAELRARGEPVPPQRPEELERYYAELNR